MNLWDCGTVVPRPTRNIWDCGTDVPRPTVKIWDCGTVVSRPTGSIWDCGTVVPRPTRNISFWLAARPPLLFLDSLQMLEVEVLRRIGCASAGCGDFIDQ